MVKKKSVCNAGDQHSIPGLGRSSWRREWQPSPVFLPGKFHGQRSLVGPLGRKESDTTEHATHTHSFSDTVVIYALSRIKLNELEIHFQF